MNEKIKELWDQSRTSGVHPKFGEYNMYSAEKFAKLIANECKITFAKVWYEQGMDIHGANISEFMLQFDEHFGVVE